MSYGSRRCTCHQLNTNLLTAKKKIKKQQEEPHKRAYRWENGGLWVEEVEEEQEEAEEEEEKEEEEEEEDAFNKEEKEDR